MSDDANRFRSRSYSTLQTGRGGASVAKVLIGTISRMDSAAQIRQSLALAYWARVVGPQAAAASEADSVQNGVLIVRTKSSVWSHELMLHKDQILRGLNRLLGGAIITDILFRAQGLTRIEEPTVTPEMPSPEELSSVILEPEEKAELRVHLESLYSLEDDRIRNAIANRMIQETKLRHWRLAHGWNVCPKCNCVHHTPPRLCPVCRTAR